MARIPKFDPFDFLLRRKFGLTFGSANADIYSKWLHGEALSDREQQFIAHIELYSCELQAISEQDLESRVEFEKEQLQEKKLRDAEDKERLHPLNQPPALADHGVFDHWSKAAYWSRDEAAALLLGRNPRHVNNTAIKSGRSNDRLREAYRDLGDLISRATTARQIDFAHGPSGYLVWARRMGIEIPPLLEACVSLRSGPLKDWRDVAAALQKELEELKSGPNVGAVDRPAEAVALGTRERNSLLKLTIGMAVAGYKYDPKAKRSDVVPEIVGDLERLGIPMDAETVRKYLRDGAELLPGELSDQLVGKT